MDDPLRAPESFEIWCARMQAIVSASFPSHLQGLKRLLVSTHVAIVPRMSPRPVVGAAPTGLGTATLAGGQVTKARLLAFLDALLAGPPAPEATPRSKTTESPLWKPTPWVFISSVQSDAEAYRQAVRNACLRKRILPVGMESWSAAPRPPAEVCRAYVRQCDLLILILLHRHGSIERESGKSYTELEYDEARAKGKDVLVFEITTVPSGVEPLKMDPDDLRQFQAFAKTLAPLVRGRAASPDQLELSVLQALDEWQVSSGG